MDVFYGCMGVAAIILSLGAVSAIPNVLGMIERLSLADKPARNRAQAERSGSPWGERR